MIPVRARGEHAWNELAEALRTTTPACSGNRAFTADDLGGRDIEELRLVCNGCAALELCRRYAVEGRPEAGVWAGRRYGSRAVDEEAGGGRAPGGPGVNGTPSRALEPLPTNEMRSARPTDAPAHSRGTTGREAMTAGEST